MSSRSSRTLIAVIVTVGVVIAVAVPLTRMGRVSEPARNSATFVSGGYISTDMPDYAPGNRVTVNGGGWMPGETVTLVVKELDSNDADRTYVAVADAAGAFSNGELITDLQDVGIQFAATATGQKSGHSASATFTDGYTATSRVSGNWSADSTWSVTRLGKISWTLGSNTVTGDGFVGQDFTSDLSPGNVITTTADVVIGTVATINGPTQVTLLANVSAPLTTTAIPQTYVVRRAPAATDDVVLTLGFTVTVDATVASNSLALTNTAGTKTLTFSGSNSLTVAGAMTMDVGFTGNNAVVNVGSGNLTLTAGNLTLIGGDSSSSNALVTVGAAGSVNVAGSLALTGNSGSATVDMSSGNGTASVGSLNLIANNNSGGRVGEVKIGTGSLSVAGDVTHGTCLGGGTGNCLLTFAGAGTANIGGSLASGLALTTVPGSTINFNGSGPSNIGAYNSGATGKSYQNIMVSKTGGAAATLAGSTTVNGNLTVNSGGIFAGSGALTLTLAGTVTNAGTIQLDGGAAGCVVGAPDNTLLIRSSVAGQRSWAGGGAFNLADVDVKDQAGSASITTTASTNSGNNGTNWIFNAACAPTTIPTTTSVTPSLNPSTYGTAVSFTATIAPGAATGSVQFVVDGSNFGSPVTVGGGTATSGSTSSLTVGTHAVVANFTGTGVYTNSTGTMSPVQTVNPASSTVTFSNLTQTYTGSALLPTVTTVPAGLSFTLTGAPDTNAGTYAVTATITEPGYTGSASGSFVINKAAAPVTLTSLSQSYTGSALSPTVTTSPLGLSFSSTGFSDTNAGTYPVTATVTDANYSGTASASFVINQAAATVTFSNLSQTYTGSALSPTVTTAPAGLTFSSTGFSDTNAGTYPVSATITDANHAGTAADSFVINKAAATVTFSNLSQTYTGGALSPTVTTAPAGLTFSSTGFLDTNAGTYPVSATITDGNHTGTAADSFVINKAAATIVVKPYNVTYDTSVHTATGTATGVGGADLSGQLTLTGTTHTDAGSYLTDPWTFAGGTNYSGASGTVSDSIAKADAAITVTAYSVTFDGAAHTATGTATGVGSASLSASLTLSGTTHTNAGPYANDAWSFAGGTNYNDASGTVNDSIAKADVAITVTPYSVTFDGAAHTATGTATGVGSANLSASLTLSGTTHTNAGPYANDAWTFAGGTNYNDASGTVNDSIAKADAAITVTPYSVTFDNAAHTAIGTATGVGGANLNADLTLSGTTHTNAGSYANDPWNFAGGTNYNDASGTVSDRIAKATAVVTVTGFSGPYDTAPHGATGSVTGVGGAAISGLAVPTTTYTNVPGGFVHWTFANANYEDQSDDAAVTITKATAVVTVTGFSGPYDNIAHGATGLVTGVGGAAISGLTVATTTYTNVPGGFVHWTFANANYEDQSDDAAVTITKATAVVTVTGFSGHYDNIAHGATGLVTGVGGAAISGLTVATTTYTNVPGGFVHWTFANANYEDQSDDAAVTITKATSSTVVGCEAGPFTYTGVPQNPCTAAVTGAGGLTEAPTPTYESNVNAGTATATYTYIGDANHDGSTDSETFAIARKPASVTAVSKGKTYGEDNPALTAAIDGTIGSESLNYSLATTAEKFSDVAGYPIAVTLGSNPNYDVTKADSTLTVNQAVATVVADARSKSYGTPNPTLTAVVTGQVAGGNALDYTLATTATTLSAVGGYPITATLGSNPNYAVSKTDSTLTVNTTTLTVTTDATPTSSDNDHFTKIYGAANPSFTLRYVGFMGADNAASLGGTLSFATLATTTSGVGAYDVTPSGQTSTNYTITFVKGTLDVFYLWDGFLQPINDTAHDVHTTAAYSSFKTGQTIPVKFELKNASLQIVTQTAPVAFTRTGYLGACKAAEGLETVDYPVAADAVGLYKLTGSQYNYGWSTKGLTAGMYQIYAALADNTTKSVYICLTR